jgi:chromosome partitioning protein
MQKGGVSKTTNACHLAVALGEIGRRVLLWDVDENYGATKVFQIPPDAFFTTMSVLTGDSSAEEAILAFDDDDVDVELPHNVDIIPSSRALQGVDRALSVQDKFYNPNECLHPHVQALKALGRYDYILIDTGPQASPTTRSAYMVSDYFILSLVPEKLAVDSLPDALEDIANARRPGRNPNLYLLGLILSCMDRRVTLAKRYEDAITERFRQANQTIDPTTATHRRRKGLARARGGALRRGARRRVGRGVVPPHIGRRGDTLGGRIVRRVPDRIDRPVVGRALGRCTPRASGAGPPVGRVGVDSRGR